VGILKRVKHRLSRATSRPPEPSPLQGFLGETNDLHRRYPGHSRIGRWSYGDLTIHVWDQGPPRTFLIMGSFCSLADRVQIFLGQGHWTDRVTTFPFSTWEAGAPFGGGPPSKGDVVIGNDVWIGTEAMIMSGVSIGDGAIIGARALVARDVEPYAVVVGNPARMVKKRFDDETIARLLEVRWWDFPDDVIAGLLPWLYGSDVEAFLERAEKLRSEH